MSGNPRPDPDTVMADHSTPSSSAAATHLKRKRSLSTDPSSTARNHQHSQPHQSPPNHSISTPTGAAHPTKTARTGSTSSHGQAHLQINYLARLHHDDLPLVADDDSLASTLAVLNDYQGVLDRHESLAANLGARPLGPILIKRLERMFDDTPKVLKSHNKDGATITWLDVVEFARNKPEQFQLSQMSEGVRVCQFYTKQCRVQISEDDFVLINSGIPQKMIPPQPIAEDEEKELGTIEILEKTMTKICHLADQVAARTRQLNHRFKGRKQAILDRRTADPPLSAAALRPASPSNVALMNGAPNQTSLAHLAQSAASQSGFVAVNAYGRESLTGNGSSQAATFLPPFSENGASPATKAELMHRFSTMNERRQLGSVTNGTPRDSLRNDLDLPPMPMPQQMPAQPQVASMLVQSPTSTTPTSAPPPRSSHHQHAPSDSQPSTKSSKHKDDRDKPDEGPFKATMVGRMETLQKGERIMPPCDRCRRLHMDCLKNLTACVGCTRKHAKCSWRDVKAEELAEAGYLPFAPPTSASSTGARGEESRLMEGYAGRTEDEFATLLRNGGSEHDRRPSEQRDSDTSRYGGSPGKDSTGVASYPSPYHTHKSHNSTPVGLPPTSLLDSVNNGPAFHPTRPPLQPSPFPRSASSTTTATTTDMDFRPMSSPGRRGEAPLLNGRGTPAHPPTPAVLEPGDGAGLRGMALAAADAAATARLLASGGGPRTSPPMGASVGATLLNGPTSAAVEKVGDGLSV